MPKSFNPLFIGELFITMEIDLSISELENLLVFQSPLHRGTLYNYMKILAAQAGHAEFEVSIPSSSGNSL